MGRVGWEYGGAAGVAGYCLNLRRIACCCWLFASCPLLACTHKMRVTLHRATLG